MKRSILPVFVVFILCTALAQAAEKAPETTPIETWTGKTILIFTPHPDDDTFGCGGIMKILADNGNNVQIVVYTNDDKGSRDLEMTSERLARIRKAEQEKACAILGIPKENITWLGYEDGNLEYADPQRLRGEAARQMKIHRPDAVFSVDPGTKSERWHKTDHRMAAFITQDAFIASEWHLYYPNHLLVEDLKPYHVPLAYFLLLPRHERDHRHHRSLRRQSERGGRPHQSVRTRYRPLHPRHVGGDLGRHSHLGQRVQRRRWQDGREIPPSGMAVGNKK